MGLFNFTISTEIQNFIKAQSGKFCSFFFFFNDLNLSGFEQSISSVISNSQHLCQHLAGPWFPAQLPGKLSSSDQLPTPSGMSGWSQLLHFSTSHWLQVMNVRLMFWIAVKTIWEILWHLLRHSEPELSHPKIENGEFCPMSFT